jgi:hypothetical protein
MAKTVDDQEEKEEGQRRGMRVTLVFLVLLLFLFFAVIRSLQLNSSISSSPSLCLKITYDMN